jgi:hypothetical protein
MLNAILKTNLCLQVRGICCKQLTITKDMLSRFNVQMYDFKKKVNNENIEMSEEEVENEIILNLDF